MKPVKDRYSKPYFSITREVGFGVESQDYEAPQRDQRRCTLVQKNKMLHHLLIDVKRDIAAEPNNTNHDPVF